MVVKVENIDEIVRIDKYLGTVTEYSRSKIEEMISKDLVLVNGKSIKSSFKVKNGDEITLPDDYIKPIEVKGEDIDLDIVYEDEYILVVNKPSGMVVHPGNGNMSHTLVNALLNHTDKLSDSNGYFRPGIVHRIDKDTSGLLLVAKNDKVHAIFAECFKNKTIKRVYEIGRASCRERV